MSEQPILMTPENAQKCFDGTKTQTRRIVKPQPHPGISSFSFLVTGWKPAWSNFDMPHTLDDNRLIKCPYGSVGDRLWVREDIRLSADLGIPVYEADSSPVLKDGAEVLWERPDFNPAYKYRRARFMPRWACRTVLELTEIRVQRLQEIGEEDALAEIGSLQTVTQEWVDDCPIGSHERQLAELLNGKQIRAKLSFMNLWESINGPGSWADNPWVWALTFKKVN